MKTNCCSYLQNLWRAALLMGLALLFGAHLAASAVTLSDQPIFSPSEVPGNLVLALSVEFPTAVTAADRDAFSATATYLGYFDPLKCYSYRYNDTTVDRNGNAYGSYFYPLSSCSGSGSWSGNFMNWATMQAVDPFRWALTGGYRVVDDVNFTILEKAYAPSNQGSTGNNFPHKSLTTGTSSVTPFSGDFYMRALRCGTRMLFKRDSGFSGDACPTTGVTAWDGDVTTASQNTNRSTTYSVDVRVKVCESATNNEANCVQYGNNYKPEGLIQKYAQKIRFSAFGYLNDPTPTGGSMLRDGGVMRARMKFVGPNQPVPGSGATTNTLAEWSAATGQFVTNPDATDATASSETGSVLTSSGVINYLNQFGRSAQAYKYYDAVSELYYAATRYLRGLPDVPEYSDLSKFNGSASTLANRTAMKDGFPVIRNWDDPVQYSCQKNFVLGIGDTNSNQDKTVPGNTSWRTNEPSTIPSLVTSDPIDVVAATNKVGVLEGDMGSTIGETNQHNASNNSAYIAGMAYLFHTTNIRPDRAGFNMNISTYWLDVLEGSGYKAGSSGRNQFYLAAKYGGFDVPTDYSYATNTSPITRNKWATTSDTLPGLGARPDNFFVANQADKMVQGLTNAFASIARSIKAYTTSFSLSAAQISSAGAASYASQYDSSNWTGTLSASTLSFAANGTPSSTPAWSSATTLETQLAGTGWDTNRRVVTWNGSTTTGAGIPFRQTELTTSGQLSALATSYGTSNTTNYLNYLRGDRTNETTSTVSGSTKAYRSRALLLGDIVDSKVTPVGPPAMGYSDAVNPGYAAFKTTWSSRPTMIYFGANDGMLHAFNGALTGTGAGTEQFAYVPSALFQGPIGTPQVDGLAALGDPNYTHHYYVDATPLAFDIDFDNAGGSFSANSNWRSLLIGGLGKGGKSFYAIDVTDPGSMTSEATVAGKVKWEFTDSTMGYSYGAPTVIKTKKYGWVVVLTSGYNNSDNIGYLYLVNPKTGALLEKISTVTSSHGLTQTTAYVSDFSDGTADAIYAGDLDGQLWRFDITAAKGSTGFYPVPVKLATLTDSSGAAQPVTTQPLVEIQPLSKKRFVMLGTGQLLASSDITSAAPQTFYAILDGNASGFSAVTTPITRSNLTAVTNLIQGVALTNTSMGWYTELGSSSSVGWRVILNPISYNGIVAFSSLLTSGDACSPSGQSRTYAIDFGTGKSILTPADITFVSSVNAITDLRFIKVDKTVRLVSGDVQGILSNVPIAAPSSLSVRLLNWREVPTVD
ncbi:pilus assembly protein [Polaromonas sp. DSP2-3-2b2]|uniref:pilus assembly protein n=1 Tax=Polaromonas sp. DSP2-3-2b2 TaxID=2804662 RepID=UPI003CE93355